MLIRRFLTRLCADNGASVAVEFAVVLPLMIAMWLGTLQICDVYRASTLLYFAAQAAADIAADEVESVSGGGTEFLNICNAAKLEMYPYTTAGNFTITMASVTNKSTFTSCPQYSDIYSLLETDLDLATPTLPCTPTYNNGVQDWVYGATVSAAGACTTVTSPTLTNLTDINDFLPLPGDSMIEVKANMSYNFGNFPILAQFGLPTGAYALSQTAFARPRDGTAAKP